MRVIAGTCGGRRLKAPPGLATRPTSDRVKEAMFSIIGPFFHGGVCLDLFAGSGALGIEALSRGMDEAVFVDRASAHIIAENVAQLGLDGRSRILRATCEQALTRLKDEGARFQAVFLDPPYAAGLIPGTLRRLLSGRLCLPGATLVVELDARHSMIEADTRLALLRDAVYGGTRLCVYEYRPDPDDG
jgi:16S rRNA (guanine966-N2)-methyltransferase